MSSSFASVLQTSIHQDSTDIKHRGKTDRAYYSAFVIATVLCFSPSKLLAYFAPMAVLGVLIVMTQKKSIVQRVSFVGLFCIFIIAVYSFLNKDFVFVSAILPLLTYSTFIIVICFDHRYLCSHSLQSKIEDFLQWVIFIQSAVGIIQAVYSFLQNGTFDSNSGDAVAGTISASLLPDGTLSNYIFGVNLGFILVFLLPGALLRRKGRGALLLGALAFIFASVIHVIIFIGVGLILAFVLCRPPMPKGWTKILASVAFIGLVITSATLLSTNWSLIPRMIEGVTNGEYPRGRAYERVFGVMVNEYPLMPIFGLGPGQFASRAAAMSSGYYLGGIDNPRGIPLLPTAMSPAFKDYLLDLWFQSKDSAGSTSQPFSSWLSLYTEFGGIAVLIVIGVMSYQILKIVVLAFRTNQRWEGTVLCAMILYLFLLGLQDVYWEVPQAILIGVMLIKLLHANMLVVPQQGYVRN